MLQNIYSAFSSRFNMSGLISEWKSEDSSLVKDECSSSSRGHVYNNSGGSAAIQQYYLPSF